MDADEAKETKEMKKKILLEATCDVFPLFLIDFPMTHCFMTQRHSHDSLI